MKKSVAVLLALMIILFAYPAYASYEVSVVIEPEGGGTVEGAGTYSDGQNADLTATAAEGFIFAGWYREGELVSTDPNLHYDLEMTRSYTARFSPKFTVTATASPQEGGSVTQSGTGEYMQGDQVTLTASPAPNYQFIGWYDNSVSGGEPVSTQPTYTFTMEDNVTLSARFSATYTLELVVNPADSGSVEGAGSYAGGSVVTITATPAPDYRFVGWYDLSAPDTIISRDAEYSLNLDEDRTIGGQFDRSFAYVFIRVLIWIVIGFAVFVVVMRLIRRWRIMNRRKRRRSGVRRY